MLRYLTNGLRYGPSSARRLLERMDPSSLDRPTGPDRFTPREVVWHLAEFEAVALARMNVALVSPGSTVPDWDEALEAEAGRYSDRDWKQALELWTARREKTVALLQEASDDELDQIFTHEAGGPMTVRTLAAAMMGHDLYHVDQLTEVAAC